MARTEALSREEVCAVMRAWGAGALSDEDMHLWATNNYFPAHQAVAQTEPDHVAVAIGLVLTEIECTKPPYMFERAGAAVAAVELIEAPSPMIDFHKDKFYKAIEPASDAL